jgi:hypothetical protein
MPGAHGGQSGHDQNSAQYYGDVKHAEEHGEKKKDKKDNGTRNMMLAGAGGLAVGGVAGAMIAGELNPLSVLVTLSTFCGVAIH